MWFWCGNGYCWGGKGNQTCAAASCGPLPLLLKELCNLLTSGLVRPGPRLCSYYTDINEQHNSNSYQCTAERKQIIVYE